MSKTIYTGLYRACGCGGWVKGHPYDPQPHYIEVSIREAEKMLREARNPEPPREEPTVYINAPEEDIPFEEKPT